MITVGKKKNGLWPRGYMIFQPRQAETMAGPAHRPSRKTARRPANRVGKGGARHEKLETMRALMSVAGNSR